MKEATIGMDLGDRSNRVCVLNEEGAITEEVGITNDRESIGVWASRYKGATVAMETGTHSPWVSRFLEELGLKVYVANARKLRAISTSNTKSDKEDARMLARLCRADVNLLSPIKHRSEACQRDLVRVKVRDALVRSRVNQMNSVRFLLKSLGVKIPSGCKATSFVKKIRADLADEYLDLVAPLLQMLDELNVKIKQVDKELEEMATQQYPETLILRQVPGVGPVTALCFVLTLESPERFPNLRQVGPYLGLTPRQDQSGDSNKQLPITKAGNSQLRKLLVNCAHYIIGPFGPPCDLRDAGMRICERGGSVAKKKAVIAVARKLSVTLLALWKSGETYQPIKEAA